MDHVVLPMNALFSSVLTDLQVDFPARLLGNQASKQGLMSNLGVFLVSEQEQVFKQILPTNTDRSKSHNLLLFAPENAKDVSEIFSAQCVQSNEPFFQ